MRRAYLVVDLGGVLFQFDHARRLRHMAAMFSLSADRVNQLLWKSGFSVACDAGQYVDAAEVRERVRVITGFAGSDEALDNAWCSAFRPDHRVREAMELHRGSRSLALFTNNGPLEEEALIRLYPTMFDDFEYLLFSHRLRHRKPDRAAFGAALRQLDADPGDVLFIDDSINNVDAARGQGWNAIHYRDPETMKQALQGRTR